MERFANHTRLPRYLPLWGWHAIRAISVIGTIAAVWLLWRFPEPGLKLFWGLAIPALPLIFLLMPGLWRNSCPLAAVNQIPRLIGFTAGYTLPAVARNAAYITGIIAFFFLVISRKWFVENSANATTLLIIGALMLSFAGGMLFKGKSGWCSTFCPILPVQRLYGQTPFGRLANTHCQPCVGCTKNCYDFNPEVAYLADQYEDDRHYVGYRRWFAAGFPGFIIGFFLTPSVPEISVAELFINVGIWMAISLAVLTATDHLLLASQNFMPALAATVAINCFYWFATPTILSALPLIDIHPPLAAKWGIQGLILLLSLTWMWRTIQAERAFLAEVLNRPLGKEDFLGSLTGFFRQLWRGSISSNDLQAQAAATRAVQPAMIGEAALHTLKSATGQGRIEVRIEDIVLMVEPEASLLSAIESSGLSIEVGCRMGVCGADPVTIIAGLNNLTPISRDEKATLDRIGCGDHGRMACSARITGPVHLRLGSHGAAAASTPSLNVDPTIKRVVIIGNGIAGITAADHIRRLHPLCVIDVIGGERHPLYNRMGITRLIHGQSGMLGLHLLPELWYEQKKITCWLNTQARRIDTQARIVILGTGESLEYDRLVIATGSHSHVPPIANFGMVGSHVIREADHAMAIRDQVQRFGFTKAVVVGAGLLGLETAYGLLKLGLKVTVLNNSARLLNKQIDERCSELLSKYIEQLGIEIQGSTHVLEAIAGEDGRLRGVSLSNGTELVCDLMVVTAGVRPNIQLASAAGIAVRHGIVVDEYMRTSAPGVYACGDVASFGEECFGLWPVAVEQAQIAARHAMGESTQRYEGWTPVTLLKIVGVDLLSAGNVDADSSGERVIVYEEPHELRYRKIIVADNQVVGAISFGFPHDTAFLTEAIQERWSLDRCLSKLQPVASSAYAA